MVKLTSIVLAAAVLLSCSTPILAQGTVTRANGYGLVAEYQAYISRDDKYNSRGQRLTTVAAILRQDRANFHALGRGDNGDTYDSYFDSRANRANLERLVRNSSVTRGAAREIINGNPTVTVRIMRDSAGTYVQAIVSGY